MPSVLQRINVSVDTGGLDQQLSAQVAQLQQIVELIVQLINDPPSDVGDFLNLATNLPLPEFSIDSQFTTALTSARDALPENIGDLTASLGGNLNGFATLTEQLGEILEDAVGIAAAIEKLVSMDFSCTSNASPPPGSNPAAERMTRTAEQLNQVNDLLDQLPPTLTVGSLLEFLFPLIDNGSRSIDFPIPILGDIVDPLRTLNRWATLDASSIGAEIETGIITLTQRLQSTAVEPINALTGELAAIQPQLALPELTTFADSYANALNDLLAALDSSAPTATTTAALNLALDNSAATLTAWEGAVATDLEALCPHLHTLDDTLLNRITHLLTLLEPVALPDQLFATISEPHSPDPAAIAAMQESVQPVVDWLNELIGLLDFSSVQGEVSTVAAEAQQIADAVEQGLTGVALQVQSFFDKIGDQLSVLDLDAVKDQLNDQIDQFGANLGQEIGDAFTPAATAISDATQALSQALDNFDPEAVIDALRSVLQAITGVLASGEIADMINEVRTAITTVTETLEQLSFAPVTDEVIGLIEQMTAALRQLQETDLNEVAKAALAVAMQVLPDDLEPVTAPLLKEFGELIEEGPVQLLEQVADKPAELLDSITRFQPGSLVGDSLSTPFREVLSQAEAFQPNLLFATIEEALNEAKQTLLREASPGQALTALSGPFDTLKSEISRYSPDTLLGPLEEQIEAAIRQVIEASPVDEIFEQVNRVFALIEQALAIPTNLVGTLQRLDSLVTQLADSGQQIDDWRDSMLDKVLAVSNLDTIGSALTALNASLTDSTHAALLSRFDSATQPLLNALDSFNPGARVTALINAHNRASGLAAGLPDSPEKTDLIAALERFNPGRAAPLRLTRQLQQCIMESRTALMGLETEWQELVESPDSLLAEISTVTADAAGLRSLIAAEVEPLLSPLRYLFSLIESVQPALQAMLTTLSDLVQQLTGGVTALTTGPASLQSITDAVQQVVDTLRNIDLGFLRTSLQQLFIQLLDQLEALNPAQLGQLLDQAFEELLEPITLNQVIPASDIETLDTAYQSLIDKLRSLDPEQLITDVVQPEYEATVVPLIEAFDLTPVFNALIEFLRGLNEELDGELGRVNGAYQGLRAARPSLGSINVNISL